MGTSNVYQSIYDGPAIDAAIARATEGGHIDASIQAKPNTNLLDNWYFGNPVNQRGQAEYAGSGYTFDRWLLNQWNTTSEACSIVTNGLRVYGESSGSCSTSIKQFVEGLKAGCQVTASVLVTDFTAGAAVYLFIRTNSGVRLTRVHFSAPGLYSVTTKIPDDFEGNLTIEIGQGGSDGGNGNTDFTVLATKLELGSQQTLAHKDANGNWVLNEIPDYGEQLARCQRYYQLYSSADQRPAKAVDCRPTMRANPSQGTIVIDGTTYYYNTADL